MYHKRSIEKIIKESINEFPIVALMGPRQVGKSTLLTHLFEKEYEYITFDDLDLRTQARRDPVLFLKNNPGKLILDEIQYVPELLPEIKIIVDKNKDVGKFILTGSQQFNLIKGMQETLAGRVLLLNLPVMTILEKEGMGGEKHWIEKLLTTGKLEKENFLVLPDKSNPVDTLLRGGLPGLLTKSDIFINPFFESYIKTYIERDLPSQFDVKDVVGLSRFLNLLAPLSSQEINKSQLGRELGVSSPTADRWLSWFRTSLIWMEHKPYHGNLIKRLSKHPKGFLFDTGLICSLLHVADNKTLMTHPMLGYLFETAMRIEFQAVIQNALLPAYCYHWRTPYGNEVDIVLEYGNRLYAFECKWDSSVKKNDTRNLYKFKKAYGDMVAFCGVLTPYGHFQQIDKEIFQVPWFLRE